MLTRPANGNMIDENHENRVPLKTPSLKRPLESMESTPVSTARKGLRDVTNSERNVAGTSVRRPSKLSRVVNEEDIAEPEFAPVLSLEEEKSLFIEPFENIPLDYDLDKIIFPRRRPFLRPHELLTTAELGDLWLEVAAKGRELEKKELEDTIRSFDSVCVDEKESDDDELSAILKGELFSDIPEEITIKESALDNDYSEEVAQ